MVLFGTLCHIAPASMIRQFSSDAQVIAVGDEYLRIVSFNFVASGIVFVASSMFQAIGNTLPPLLTSFVRILAVSIPAVVMSRMPGFELRWLWYLTVASVTLQMLMNLLLLRREFRLRLSFEPAPAA
jgi:Na+-driven multidrug efflux pump